MKTSTHSTQTILISLFSSLALSLALPLAGCDSEVEDPEFEDSSEEEFRCDPTGGECVDRWLGWESEDECLSVCLTHCYWEDLVPPGEEAWLCQSTHPAGACPCGMSDDGGTCYCD